MHEKLESMKRLTENGVVAVIRNVPSEKIIKVAESLLKGGVNVLELTLDSVDSFNEIKKLVFEFQGKAVIGAGTVLDAGSAELAIRSGAEFIVSPVLREDIIRTTLRKGKISIPGVLTPTEIMDAVEFGADIVKVFPASVGGPEFIKNVRGPFPQIPIIPTGGVDLSNAAAFIKAGAIAIGAGGNLVSIQSIDAGNYSEIIETASEYVKIVKAAREES